MASRTTNRVVRTASRRRVRADLRLLAAILGGAFTGLVAVFLLAVVFTSCGVLP